MTFEKIEKEKTAVLGATGLVGQQFIRLLQNHPLFSLDCLVASDQKQGQAYADAVKWRIGDAIPDEIKQKKLAAFSLEEIKRKGIRYIFSALPASISHPVESALRDSGCAVFSNSSAFRMDPEVPIVVPDVNPEHLELIRRQQQHYGGYIVTNPNCSTAGIVTVLKPLLPFGLNDVYVSTYQSVSGGGLNGVSAMEIQNNVIPYIPKEEKKIRIESMKILNDPDCHIVASCCRVPILYSHLVSLVVNLKKEVPLSGIISSLCSFSNLPEGLSLHLAPENSIEICDEIDRPQPALDFPLPYEPKNAMVVKVGRIEKVGKSLKMFLLFNNTLKGAAGSSVLNAEIMLQKTRTGVLS